MEAAGREGKGGTTAIALIRLGIACGLFTCIGYPVLIFVPLPRVATAALAALLGPSLGVASVGLREFLRLHRPSAAAQLGALFNVAAGALFSAMLLVQLAVRQYATDEPLSRRLVGVWLGLDVAWDVYIGLGTLLFALAMLRHPRFGPLMAFPGLLVAAVLLVLNLATFPTPPGEAGSIDVGPLVGLWYLAVTIQLWRSLPWYLRQASSPESASFGR